MLYTIAWYKGNDEIVCAGRSQDGARKIFALGDYPRFFYVGVPDHWVPCGAACIATMKASIRARLFNMSMLVGEDDVRITAVTRRNIMGAEQVQNTYLKLAFTQDRFFDAVRKWLNGKRMFYSSQQGKIQYFEESQGRVRVSLYEDHVSMLSRLLQEAGITPHCWIHEVPGEPSFANVRGVGTQPPPPKLTIASWDIEVYSEDGSFPQASRRADYIAQVGLSFGDMHEVKTRKILCLDSTDAVENADVLVCGDETKLIQAFFAALREADVDVLCGYNTFGFDWGYVLDRLSILGMDLQTTLQLGHRIPNAAAVVVQKELESNAYGSNLFRYVAIPAVCEIDMLTYCRKEIKLPSYGLGYVASSLIGDTKHDLPAQQIFEKLRGSSTDRAICARYCLQDTDLVYRLIVKLKVVQKMLAMGNVTFVPFDQLLTSGQQIKVKSQVLRTANAMGYILPSRPPPPAAGTYQGATVLEAEAGFYEDAVAGLDFASLYPSVMIAYNMSCDTHVTHIEGVPREAMHEIQNKDACRVFAAKEGVAVTVSGMFITMGSGVYRVEWEGAHTNGQKTISSAGDFLTFSDAQRCTNPFPSTYFMKEPVGVLPCILSTLWERRKQVKREMKAEKDPFLKSLLDAEQLAVKLSMNSIYGVLGSDFGVLPAKAIAAAVTTQGRNLLMASKRYVEEHFPAHVVYGDSVAGDTRIRLCDSDGLVTFTGTFAELDLKLGHSWQKRDDGKECCVLENTFVEGASRKPYNKVHCAIRHACQKDMYRVTTSHNGNEASVCVTEDHCLVSEDGLLLRPEDMVIGETCLKQI